MQEREGLDPGRHLKVTATEDDAVQLTVSATPLKRLIDSIADWSEATRRKGPPLTVPPETECHGRCLS